MLARAVLLTALVACSFPTKHFAGGGGGGDAPMQSDGSAGGGDGSGSGSGIAIDDLPGAMQNAFCTYEVRCQTEPTMAICIASNPSDTTSSREELAAVSAGKSLYDPVEAAKCVDAVTNLACQLAAIQGVEASCSKVFTGTVDNGGACTGSIECKSQQCQSVDPNCNTAMACCAGTCVSPPAKVAIGQPCASTTTCVDGAYCNTQTNPAVCAAQGTAAGQACGAYNGCVAPLYCGIDSTGKYSSCVMPAAENQPCDPNQYAQACLDMRDYCNRVNAICTPNIPVGSTCPNNTGARCVGYAYCSNNVCQQLPSQGQSCPAGLPCLGSLQCLNGSCMQPAAVDCGP